MFIKNEDLQLMTKIENLIGMNERRLFGKDKSKVLTYTIYGDPVTITHDDFISYINLIERLIQNKKALSNRSNAYNKANKEYHNIMVSMAHAKKAGNEELYNKWRTKFEEYKTKRGCK